LKVVNILFKGHTRVRDIRFRVNFDLIGAGAEGFAPVEGAETKGNDKRFLEDMFRRIILSTFNDLNISVRDTEPFNVFFAFVKPTRGSLVKDSDISD
jgi:hypothetical protein